MFMKALEVAAIEIDLCVLFLFIDYAIHLLCLHLSWTLIFSNLQL